MLAGRTTTFSLIILAAGMAAMSQAHARSQCTPQHLLGTLRQVEAQCGKARVVSGHRPGATIRGTRRASQHSFCNGKNGAIDAVFANRACALSALRQANYTVLTYRSSRHIHIGTDGWASGRTRVAHRGAARVRTAARQRASVRLASRQRAGVRVAYRQRPRAANQASDWNWSSEW
jgi:hypothetical protein